MTFTEEEYRQLQREYLEVHKGKEIERATMPKVTEEEAIEIEKRIEDANAYMIGGNHYQQMEGEQHWDRVWRLYGSGYFVGCISKYLERYHLKDGIRDLLKARHYLDKLIELEQQKAASNNTDSPNTEETIHLSIGWEGGQYTVACGVKDPKVSSSNRSSVTCKKCIKALKEKDEQNHDTVTHYCHHWGGEHYLAVCGVQDPVLRTIIMSEVTCDKCFEIVKGEKHDS